VTVHLLKIGFLESIIWGTTLKVRKTPEIVDMKFMYEGTKSPISVVKELYFVQKVMKK